MCWLAVLLPLSVLRLGQIATLVSWLGVTAAWLMIRRGPQPSDQLKEKLLMSGNAVAFRGTMGEQEADVPRMSDLGPEK